MERQIRVKIRGIADYLQHRPTMEPEDNVRKSGEIDYSNEWQKSMYFDDEIGCYIPAEQIKASLVQAGKSFRIKGRMGKSYKDFVKATVFIDPNRIPLGKKEPDYIHEAFVVIQRNQVLRRRPAFKKGWEAEFNLVVLDEQIGTDRLKQIIEYAGKFCGIGDWRPDYGRFEIVEFEENSK